MRQDPTGMLDVGPDLGGPGDKKVKAGDKIVDDNGNVIYVDVDEATVLASKKKYMAVITFKREYKELSNWDKFVRFITNAEESMKSDYQWKWGVEFKTNDGESNGQSAPSVDSENWDEVYTVYWDEVEEFVFLVNSVGKDKLSKVDTYVPKGGQPTTSRECAEKFIHTKQSKGATFDPKNEYSINDLINGNSAQPEIEPNDMVHWGVTDYGETINEPNNSKDTLVHAKDTTDLKKRDLRRRARQQENSIKK